MNVTRGIQKLGLWAVAGWILAAGQSHAAAGDRVYFGTYTEGSESQGIYVSDFDQATGKLGKPELAAEAVNPSFLALHPNGTRLYSVNEVAELDDKHEGGVSAFAIDAETGKLSLLNRVPSKGTAPCHLSVRPQGDGVIVANYGNGTVSAYRLSDGGNLEPLSVVFQAESGSGANKARQEGPHAHCMRFHPSRNVVFEADLGADAVFALRFDPNDQSGPLRFVSETKTAAGAGPRHMAFHPSGQFMFVNNELNSTVTAYRVDSDSFALTEVMTLPTLPAGGHEGNSTAESVLHPNGRFLYVSNRGHDSLAIFEVDAKTGRLTAKGHQKTGGKTPRNFNIDPTGKFLLAANQDSNTVVVFTVDSESGRLAPTGQVIEVPKPVCVLFAPAAGK